MSRNTTKGPSPRQGLLSFAVAFTTTLMALPSHAAIAIPDLPLQTGAAYPAPNIMFILDNSGSMEYVAMPADRSSLSDNPSHRSYLNNTIYYDPRVTYKPWATAVAGERLVGGTAVDKVYSSTAMTTGSIDLRGNSESIFYVPKAGVTASTNSSDFDRYWINSSGKVVTLGPASSATPSGFPKSGLSANKNNYVSHSFTVPVYATSIIVTTSGGSGDADLSLYDPSSVQRCNQTSSGNDHTCTMSNPQQGAWEIRVNGGAKYSGVKLAVEIATVPEVEQTPTGRSQADELKNIATWYSYHRSRLKTGKAGASEAFSQLGSNMRVGYDSISKKSSVSYPIPVGTAGGLFQGANRTKWFQLLHDQNASGWTPLRSALRRTGEYIKSDAAWGPVGAGGQAISCRQNFAILTTDGYWNTNDDDSNFSIGNVDGVDGQELVSADGKAKFTYKAIAPYTDSVGNTLADVAMYYWKNDLSSLANNVPTSAANPAFWQHMVTFGVSIGLKGNLDPAVDLPSIVNGTKNWGDPVSPNSETPRRIDDLWHAAVNGRGKFVVASNSDEFARSLVDALATVAARLGSASNVTANSTSFQSDTRVYQASYVSGKWTGEVAAYDVSSAGVSATPQWLASNKIPGIRKIFSWYGSEVAGKGTFAAVAPTAILARENGLAVVTGPDNRDYLAGSSALETRNGGKLRDRDTLLGDIANSSPMYVRDTETLFVGANDGMLHAFDALTGAERFAYVPRGINWTQLANLSDPQYGHHYFVDGPVVVSTRVQTPNKNYLVGALGRGGKGVFGLDVTAPGSFAKQQILWDNTGDYAPTNMGQVLGDPLVVTLNGGKKGVIVSNGINSSTGTASLFILDIADGTVIKELNTGVTGDNGLSAPRGADIDGNGTVDFVYAGDLKGNLWKFDLNGAESEWKIANGGAAMFAAKDSGGKAQPITAGVALARNPADGKIWVLFGTGSFMTTADMTNTDIQSMYGVIDEGIVSRGDLAKRNITVETTKDGRNVRAFDPNRPALEGGKKGWVIDLDKPTAGERIVSNPRVTGTVLLTASLIPPTTNTCDAGGTGYINAVDVFTGTSVKDPYFDSNGDGQYNDDDTVKDENGNDLPVGSIDLGVGMPTMPTIIDKLLVVGGSKGNVGTVPVNPQGGAARRLSWREVMGD
ncbi:MULTISPECIES: PilC/PilY family type IV pilus protein [Lysobacter]|uniref:PilC/PilY family type IV pilus protein n=1 Tax=Lysobacteraceae TaxID=32033 RepID=UPI000B2ECB40|nr:MULTISPECIES: PilC/PilY family type IV pilus protein [Lysobacter]